MVLLDFKFSDEVLDINELLHFKYMNTSALFYHILHIQEGGISFKKITLLKNPSFLAGTE